VCVSDALVGWWMVFRWLVGWWVGCWLVSWLIDWRVGRLVSWLVVLVGGCWLVAWLITGSVADRSVGWWAVWLDKLE
jgi:hypothetical protein